MEIKNSYIDLREGDSFSDEIIDGYFIIPVEKVPKKQMIKFFEKREEENNMSLKKYKYTLQPGNWGEKKYERTRMVVEAYNEEDAIDIAKSLVTRDFYKVTDVYVQ